MNVRRIGAVVAGALVAGGLLLGAGVALAWYLMPEQRRPLEDVAYGPDQVQEVKRRRERRRKRRADPDEATKKKKKDKPEGRWAAAPDEEVDPEIAALEAIGYLSGTKEGSGKTGVTVDDPRAFDGYNFWSGGHGTEARLMTMQGEVVHTWSKSYDAVFPVVGRDATARHHWRRATLLPGGDVIVVFGGQGIMRLDKDSNLVWANTTDAHHDAHVLGDEVWTLTRRAKRLKRIHAEKPTLVDYVLVLDLNTGEQKARYNVLSALERSDFAGHVANRYKPWGDIFHTNAIEVLDGRLADKNPAFAAGNVLLSMRGLNLLTVLDPNTKTMVWAFKGSFQRQHDPRTLDADDGTIILFDNKGGLSTKGRPGRGSRILLLDPLPDGTREQIVYRNSATTPFYSEFCGTAVRLPNANILIAETDTGRAFELSPDREIVWEFYTPERGGDNGEFIAALFDVERIPADFDVSWASNPLPASTR